MQWELLDVYVTKPFKAPSPIQEIHVNKHESTHPMPTTLKKWGDLKKKVINKVDTSSWLYQDNNPVPNLPMEDDNRGLQLMIKWGYNKNEKLGQNDNLLEHLILEIHPNNLGLGLTTSKMTIQVKGTPIKVFISPL
jgi:hypothetical protein